MRLTGDGFQLRRSYPRLGVAVLAVLLAAQLTAASASPVVAVTVTGSVWSNVTAFSGACDGTYDTISSQLYTLAMNGLAYLTYARSGYTGTAFTRAAFLNRVGGDRAVYVHSHGDYYGGVQGFREDAGKCTGGLVTDSADVDSKVATPAQVVVMSTCRLGESHTQSMSAAFGISQNQQALAFEFYMGYTHHPYSGDMLAFEQEFWSLVQAGGPNNPIYSLAEAFSISRSHHAFTTPPGDVAPAPAWYGNYYYTGWADTSPGCTNCE